MSGCLALGGVQAPAGVAFCLVCEWGAWPLMEMSTVFAGAGVSFTLRGMSSTESSGKSGQDSVVGG